MSFLTCEEMIAASREEGATILPEASMLWQCRLQHEVFNHTTTRLIEYCVRKSKVVASDLEIYMRASQVAAHQ